MIGNDKSLYAHMQYWRDFKADQGDSGHTLAQYQLRLQKRAANEVYREAALAAKVKKDAAIKAALRLNSEETYNKRQAKGIKVRKLSEEL